LFPPVKLDSPIEKRLYKVEMARMATASTLVKPSSGHNDLLAAPDISVIVPIYNEEENLDLLVTELWPAIEQLGRPFEVVLVNDGSTDGSLDKLRQIAAEHAEARVVDFRRNYGQTAAMMAGIDHARGTIIISIDADLQNDPADISKLLARLDEGYDVVSGWRKNRQDAAIRRNFVSRVANRLISRLSGVELHDYGCTLKAYRSDVVKGVRLYGEMHRFIPIYASWQGARVTELPVGHRARKFGKSKYGLERVAKVILDLLVVLFLDRYFVKPIYVFGAFGLLALGASSLFFLWMLSLKLFTHINFIQTPLPILTALTALLGVNSILMGLLAEMLVRTYFESQGRTAYLVREVIDGGRT
jgi:dolichol-phosphate mannosyltransferase